MNRLPGLDLLRSIAILAVMCFHAPSTSLGNGPLADLSMFGWAGVDLFFVLSGYLIGWQLLKEARGGDLSLRSFYLRRAMRILPAFLAMLAVYFAFPALREAGGIQPAWQFLSFTLNFFIDTTTRSAFSHAWSLCVEEHFYLLFPLLVLVLVRSRATVRTTIALCGTLVLAGIGLRAQIWLTDVAPAGAGFVSTYLEAIYYPTYTRIDGLLAGVMVAATRAFRPLLWEALMRRPGWLLAGGLAGTGLSLTLFSARFALAPTVVGFPLLSSSLALLVMAAVSPDGILGRARVPGAAALAAISYSVYLSHKWAYHALDSIAGPSAGGGSQPGWAHLPFALAVGAFLYGTVERPFLRWRDRLAPGGRRLAPAG